MLLKHLNISQKKGNDIETHEYFPKKGNDIETLKYFPKKGNDIETLEYFPKKAMISRPQNRPCPDK